MFRSIRLTQIAAMLAALGSLAVAPQASAGSILGAVGASINSGGPGFGSINDTFNQAGLRTTYISGVTDFDSYIASQPSHSYDFWGNEWYGIPSGASASVTYDLGAVHTVNAFALWNEDIFGLGRFNLLYSGDGKQFTALLTNVTPHVNPDEVDYGPESFTFGAVSARYFRVEAPNCPLRGDPYYDSTCAIGEVAWREAAAAPQAPLPEPGSLALVSLALTGLSCLNRRRGH